MEIELISEKIGVSIFENADTVRQVINDTKDLVDGFEHDLKTDKGRKK